MKVASLFLLVLIGLVSNARVKAQSHWSVVYDGKPIDWTFTGPDTGFLLCDSISGKHSFRLAKRTTDGGVTWSNMVVPSGGFKHLSFSSSKDGFISGEFYNSVDDTLLSFLFHTSDGGSSWSRVQWDTDYFISDLQFVTPLTGYAFSSRQALGSNDWRKTTNGGLTWTETTLSPDLPVYIKDESRAFFFDVTAAGEGPAYHLQGSFDDFHTQVSYPLSAGQPNFTFVDDSTWLFMSYGDIYGTKDGGQLWSKITAPRVGSAYNGLVFYRELGYLCGQNGTWKTTNKGISWGQLTETINFDYGRAFPNNVAFVQTVYPDSPRILKTTDGGGPATYANIESPKQLQLTVAPNPSSNQITLYGLPENLERIEVMNAVGMKVLAAPPSPNTLPPEEGYALNISSLPAGAYLVRVITPSGKMGRSFVKQ